MRMRFVACPACARHVRAGDPRCPFCGASPPDARPLRTLRQRLSRAAMHAAGAAGAIVAISDCGGQESPNQPFYGGSCVEGQCGVVMTDSGADANDANNTVFYGAPCLDGSCVFGEAGADGSEASADASEDVEDAGISDGAGDDGPGAD